MRQITGFDKRYFCDENGTIYSNNYKNSKKIKKIKPALDAKGYLRTMILDEEGKYQTIKVHRIIALTFIPKIEGKNQVNHKNGIKTDNRVENLEWCNNRENIVHAYKNNMINVNHGDKHHKSILKRVSAKELLDSYSSLKSIKLVAEMYNLDRHAVSRNIKRLLNETNTKTNTGI